jgi:hypothetical protein
MRPCPQTGRHGSRTQHHSPHRPRRNWQGHGGRQHLPPSPHRRRWANRRQSRCRRPVSVPPRRRVGLSLPPHRPPMPVRRRCPPHRTRRYPPACVTGCPPLPQPHLPRVESRSLNLFCPRHRRRRVQRQRPWKRRGSAMASRPPRPSCPRLARGQSRDRRPTPVNQQRHNPKRSRWHASATGRQCHRQPHPRPHRPPWANQGRSRCPPHPLPPWNRPHHRHQPPWRTGATPCPRHRPRHPRP